MDEGRRGLSTPHDILDIEPEMYLIPSTAWREPMPPFSWRDYPGLKSQPEYGMALSIVGMRRLQDFRFTGQPNRLTPDAASAEA